MGGFVCWEGFLGDKDKHFILPLLTLFSGHSLWEIESLGEMVFLFLFPYPN